MVSFFFSSAIRLTGPFVTMVYSMIVGDMLTFGIIYSIVLFGFSQSFYFLYKGFPGVKTSLYHSYSSTWMALFQITLGDYNVSMCLLDYGIIHSYKLPNFSRESRLLLILVVIMITLSTLWACVIELGECF